MASGISCRWRLKALAVGLCLVATSCNIGEKRDAKRPRPPVPVQEAKVEQRDTPHFLRGVGRVRAFESVDIKARVTGQILKLEYIPGSRVSVGQLLYTIDPAPFKSRLMKVEAQLKAARAELEHARVDLERYRVLLSQKMATPEKFETMSVNFRTKQAMVEQREAERVMARLDLDYCSIYSPVDGKPGALLIDVGNMVSAYQNTLVNIKQTQPIKVEFSLPEKFLPKITEAFSAGIVETYAFTPGSRKPEIGHLMLINNSVNPTTGMVLLRGKFENGHDRLWPGQFVKVLLKVDETKNALLIPSNAVNDGPKGRYVWIVKGDDTVEMRPVTVDRRVDNMFVIAQGIKPHERVVTNGQLMLFPGAKVITRAQMEELVKKKQEQVRKQGGPHSN